MLIVLLVSAVLIWGLAMGELWQTRDTLDKLIERYLQQQNEARRQEVLIRQLRTGSPIPYASQDWHY